MTRRLPLGLLVAAVPVAGGIAAVIFLRTLSNALAAADVEAAVARDVRAATAVALVAIIIPATLLAWIAVRAAVRSLGRARAAVLARARGEDVPGPRSRMAELDELFAAVDRLHARLRAREADSAHERQQLNVLLDAISEGILRLDAEGRVTRANGAALALLGLDGDIRDRPVATLVRHAELRRILELAAAGRTIAGSEIALDDRRLLVSARPLPPATGEAGAVVAFVDLTELRRLEGVRRDFVANVSHELKTPLTSIRGYVETLLADDDLPPDTRRQFLEVVEKNAARLHSIVDDLLDLSRLQSGGWRPELVDVDTAALIDDVWAACRARADSRGITFRPPASAPHVLADPAGLRQVLSNLFDNAIRHTPGGTIEVVLDRATPNGSARAQPGPPDRTDRPFVTFAIRDTGSGIPSDALPRVFERFYRVDPARSRADGGTGLGLSIVKHLVESMGGAITADSELGKGTTIRFTLPAAP